MLNEQIICDFLRQSIELIKAILPPQYHQWNSTKIERKANSYTIKPSTRPDFWHIFTIDRVRHQLLYINEIARTLEADSRYRGIIGESTVSPWLEPDYVMLSTLREYIWQLTQLNYEEQGARRIANNFLRSLNDASSVIVCYSVVRGLECDFECYNFSSGIRLRKLTDPEICQLIEREETLFQDDRLPRNPCLLEQQFQLPVDQMSDTNVATANFNEVITALRLLKEGCVERQITYTRLEYPGQLGDVGHSIRAINKRHPISQSYTLSEADLPDLEQILTAIKSGRIPVRLQTAVDRVNFAAERDRAEDQILDLLIAMEAIFGDSQGAIGYKIGLRCAVFAENDYEERNRISKLINDAYSRRSALVHGGRSKSMGTLKLTTDEIVKELLVLIAIASRVRT